MSLIVNLVAIGFFLVVILFLIPVLVNINDIAEKGLICGVLGICITPTEETERFKEEVDKQEKEAEARLPSTVGKTVCDLSIYLDAELVERDFTIKIDTDESNPSDYQWHCQFQTPLNWLANVDFTPLAFFLESEFVSVETVLIDMSDTSKRYDANHPEYKEMRRDVRLTQTTGFVETPLNFDQTFYIEDIVHDDYVLEIYYGRPTNDLKAGEPVIDKVCRVGVNC